MSGIFNPGIFNTTAFNTGTGAVTPEVVKTGTGGIVPKRRRTIVKPLGTLGVPRKGKAVVDARIADSRAIHAEVAAQIAKEFSEEIAPRTMSMAQVHFEIG